MPAQNPVVNSAPSLGNIRVHACVALASRTAPSLATNIDASSSVNMSCVFAQDGYQPATSQSVVTANPRLCTKAETERLGFAKHSMGTLKWSQGDPQNPVTAVSTLMVTGALLYFLDRKGPDANVAFALADKVRSHYVVLGEVYDTEELDEAGEFYKACEAVYVDAGPIAGVVAA